VGRVSTRRDGFGHQPAARHAAGQGMMRWAPNGGRRWTFPVGVQVRRLTAAATTMMTIDQS